MSLNSQPSTLNFSYSYDAAWRLTNVTAAAGVFSYGFVGASTLVQKLILGNAATITNSYGPLAQLTGTYLKDNAGLALNLHQYVHDPGNLRTQQLFTAGNSLSYTYDSIGQLKTALGRESGGAARFFEQLGYTYDAAGNLNHRTNNALVQTFNNNSLNELTTLTRSGTLTVAGNTTTEATNVTVNALVADRYADRTYARTNFPLVNGPTNFTAIAQSPIGLSSTNTVTVDLRSTTTFAFDLNGNLTNDGTRTFIYDAENQLVTNFVANTWKTEHVYDGFGRKRITRDYRWDTSSSNWAKTNEVRYVYDGLLAIQERDSGNNPLVTYTRGLDLGGSLQGAGGIGGLLARTDHTTLNPQLSTSFYHSDGSGNVTALISTNGLVVARYAYDPFGGLTKMSGPLAAANRYRFSSKEFQLNSGLYYYGYRFYEPNLQRWLNEDPLGEEGGINFYRYVRNSPIMFIDPYGEDAVTIGPVTVTIPFTTEDWEEASQTAHEKQHREDFLNGMPGWKKEQRGFAAEIPVLKKQIADTQAIIDFQKKRAKECIPGDPYWGPIGKKAWDANIAGFQALLNQLNQALSTAETIANSDEAAMDYWNAAARRWYQEEVHPAKPIKPSTPAPSRHPLDVERGGPGRRF
jgi:RHS repeat-associated protein